MIQPNNSIIIVRKELPKGPSDIIAAPDQSIAEATEGTVLYVGVGMASKYAPRARVVFGKYAGTVVKVEGEELLALEDDDIIGTFAD